MGLLIRTLLLVTILLALPSGNTGCDMFSTLYTALDRTASLVGVDSLQFINSKLNISRTCATQYWPQYAFNEILESYLFLRLDQQETVLAQKMNIILRTSFSEVTQYLGAPVQRNLYDLVIGIIDRLTTFNDRLRTLIADNKDQFVAGFPGIPSDFSWRIDDFIARYYHFCPVTLYFR